MGLVPVAENLQKKQQYSHTVFIRLSAIFEQKRVLACCLPTISGRRKRALCNDEDEQTKNLLCLWTPKQDNTRINTNILPIGGHTPPTVAPTPYVSLLSPPRHFDFVAVSAAAAAACCACLPRTVTQPESVETQTNKQTRAKKAPTTRKTEVSKSPRLQRGRSDRLGTWYRIRCTKQARQQRSTRREGRDGKTYHTRRQRRRHKGYRRKHTLLFLGWVLCVHTNEAPFQ